MPREFCTVERALEELSAGRVIIVADSEDRENEGDFLAAAQHVNAEMIHFMISVGRGQLCMPVSAEMAQRLQLQSLVVEPCQPGIPRFTMPLDHKSCTTGISPLERARTIQAMLDPTIGPEEYIRPGHIFPLVARPGGVLERTGHTETAVDLGLLAGLAPAGVLCEICSRDGRNMALRDELFEIAAEYGLVILTIDALIEYRRQHRELESTLLQYVNAMQHEVSQDVEASAPITVSVSSPVSVALR